MNFWVSNHPYQIFLSLSRSLYGRCCSDCTVLMHQAGQTCWSVFHVRKALSFLYSKALPCSSMSRIHYWWWCHFSDASMGTGICTMTPPPPLITNSAFNTSAKRPVCHTGFELVPFSSFTLNNGTLSFAMKLVFLDGVWCWAWLQWKQITLDMAKPVNAIYSIV